MSADNQNFIMSAGDDFIMDFGIPTRETDGRAMVAEDIREVYFFLTPYETQGPVLISKKKNMGVIVAGDANITVILTSADTIGYCGDYTYELKIESSLGTQTGARGRISIKYSMLGAN